MAKFRIRLKVQGIELEVDGEREDIPLITSTVQRQISGLFDAADIVAEAPKQLRSGVEDRDGDGASSKGRGSRRRGATRSSGEAETPIDFRHDSAKFGNPVQSWSVTEKCIWLLYVLKRSVDLKEVSAAQLVVAFNSQFKAAGKLHPPNVTRELAKAKLQNPAPVGEDKGLWFVTGEGERQAGELVKSVAGPSLV